MPRGAVVLITFALVGAGATAAGSTTSLPTGFTVAAKANLYRGVDYVKLTRAKSPVVAAHIAHVTPGAPVDLRVVNANDKISTSPRELETTSSMCRRVHCVVGVNGDFHTIGEPAGAVIVDRRMLHSPDPSRPQLTLTGDGRLVAGPLPWSGSVSAIGLQIAVAALNTDPPADGLAVFTPAYGSRTDPSTRTELVVGAPGGVGLLNRPGRLQVRGLRTGGGPIPADGAVLSAGGVAAQQLQDLWAKLQSAKSGVVELEVTSPVDAVMSLGAEPVVLRDGRRAPPWRDPNLVNPRQPHTLVGWNPAGEVFLVAVDGRQAGSDGMTMAEAADFLLALGVTDAVNLDGGGGTTFVAGGSVWNRPSDNDPVRPAQYEERGSANALVVMARPGAPLPAAAPPVPGPLPTAPGATSAPGSGPVSVLDWSEPSDSPDGGSDGGLFGPVLGVGGPAAPGELPLGPAAASHFRPVRGEPGTASGESIPGGAQSEPGGPGPAGPAGVPSGSAATESAAPAASPSTRRFDSAAWKFAGLGALAALAAGAGILTAALVERRPRWISGAGRVGGPGPGGSRPGKAEGGRWRGRGPRPG